MQAIGFPDSVRSDVTIAVPQWVYYNSSGGTWSPDLARNAVGADHTTLSPVPSGTAEVSPSVAGKSPSLENPSTSRSSGTQLSKGMAAAIICCSVLAGLVLMSFLTYLLRLCYRKRQQKRLKAFSDGAFDKVQLTPKTPRKTKLRMVLSRLSLVMPRASGSGAGLLATPRLAQLRTIPAKSVDSLREKPRPSSSQSPIAPTTLKWNAANSKTVTDMVAESSPPIERRLKSVLGSDNQSTGDNEFTDVSEAGSMAQTVATGSAQHIPANFGGTNSSRSSSADFGTPASTLHSVQESTFSREPKVRSQAAIISRWSESSQGVSLMLGSSTGSQTTSLANTGSSPGRSLSNSSKTYKSNSQPSETLKLSQKPILSNSAQQEHSAVLPLNSSPQSDTKHASGSSLTSMLRRLDKLDFGVDKYRGWILLPIL